CDYNSRLFVFQLRVVFIFAVRLARPRVSMSCWKQRCRRGEVHSGKERRTKSWPCPPRPGGATSFAHISCPPTATADDARGNRRVLCAFRNYLRVPRPCP